MPEVHIADDGIVRIDYRAFDRVTLDVAKKAYEKQRAMSQGEQRPVLILGQNVLAVEDGVADFINGDKVQSVTKAAAVLTKSFMEEMLGNMYLLANNPPFPTRLFTSESGAKRWLSGYVN